MLLLSCISEISKIFYLTIKTILFFLSFRFVMIIIKIAVLICVVIFVIIAIAAAVVLSLIALYIPNQSVASISGIAL